MKSIKIFALTAVMLTVALVSCSKDETFSSPSSNISAIRTNDGVMTVLKSIKADSWDWFNFNYDGDGRCTSIYDSGELSCELSYAPFEFKYKEDGGSSFDMTFNSSGYLSKVNYYDEHSGDGYSCSGKGTYIYSYNDSHLTKVSGNYSETGTDDGEKFQYSYEDTMTLTWTNGNVTKIVSSGKGTEDDTKFTQNYTYIFEYGNVENEYLQFTNILVECSSLYLSPLGFIGYFGKGTTLLPKSCEWKYEEHGEWDGGEYNYEEGDTLSISYTKNSDGLINTETEDGWTFTYLYDYISPGTRSMVMLTDDNESTETSAKENAEPHRRMFDSRGQHHSPHHNNVHSHEK